MAVRAHYHKVRLFLLRQGQQRGAVRLAARLDLLGFGLDPMTGEMLAECAARQIAGVWRVGARIHHHHLDLIGAFQQRQGVVHRAHGFAPPVPCNQHPRARVLVHRRGRKEKHGSPALQHDAAGAFARRRVASAFSAGKQNQVRQAGALDHQFRALALRAAPVPVNIGGGAFFPECRLGALRLLIMDAAVVFQHLLGQLRLDIAGKVEYLHRVQAGEIRSLLFCKPHGVFDHNGTLTERLHAKQNIAKLHDFSPIVI